MERLRVTAHFRNHLKRREVESCAEWSRIRVTNPALLTSVQFQAGAESAFKLYERWFVRGVDTFK